MKIYNMIPTFIISCALIISGCSQSISDIKSITVTVDPNKKENKYQVINIMDKDSIQTFMKKLNNKKMESIKFYPRFTIEINHNNKVEKYLGNANHIIDSEGRTYKLLAKDWEIFNY